MKHASRVLARAFQDDPLWAYFFSNSAERQHKLQEIFSMFLRHAVSYGEVYATSSILEGVAVWLTSDKADISPWRIMRSGGISVMLKMGWAEITRSMRYTEYESAIHEQCAPSRHWYLQFIGIDPES